MKKLGESVKALRTKKGWSQTELARQVSRLYGKEITQQAIQQVEKGKTLTPGYIAELAASLGLSVGALKGWSPELHIGNTPDLPPGDDEPHPDSTPEMPAGVARTPGMLPEVDLHGGLGGGGMDFQELTVTDEYGNRLSADVVVAEWSLPEPYLRSVLNVNPKDAWLMEVIGDSMEPTLESGDKLLIDTSYSFPSPEGLYAMHDGNSVVVKRLEHDKRNGETIIRETSDNPLHTNVKEHTVDEVNIIGRVAWFARRI